MQMAAMMIEAHVTVTSRLNGVLYALAEGRFMFLSISPDSAGDLECPVRSL
jgi:hypothetical protein